MFYYRDEEVDGFRPHNEGWLWVEGDNGLWDGPKLDWQNSHVHKIKEFVKQWNVVVQAGGGCGVYPRLLSRLFGTVYTFEPDMANFHCLSYNCCTPNIFKFQAALGETHAMVGINDTNTSNRGTHSIIRDENPRKTIIQLRIDDLELPFCDLIMLDIEGYEKYALDGAGRTIAKFKPVIFAEGGGRVEEQLKGIGYHRVDNSVADTIFLPE